GFAQSLLLKKYAPIDFKWILGSIAGMGVPFIFLDFIPSDTIPHKLPLSIALGGLTVGLLQYLLLIKYFRKGYLWIPGCFLGWTLGVLTVFTIDYTKYLALNNLITAFINLLLILAGGVVLGVISGIALKKILE
ncbi:MAG TPA: hypothetical protein PLU53_03385, partial [Bacteroidia bacterium]|nr:hypothetical protein [Bacteroidia bacterium]